MIGLGLSINTANRTLATQVSAIFRGNGYNGFMYDVNDISTLNQVSTGTTPVTAVTQPVGLMLDKHLGLQLGPELVTNGDFSSGTTGWAAGDAGATISSTGGIFRITNGDATPSFAAQFPSLIPTIGKTYKVTGNLISKPSSGAGRIVFGGFDSGAVIQSGLFSFVITATTTGPFILSTGSSSVIGDFSEWDNISVKLLDGNHALQATAAARPTWQVDASGYHLAIFLGTDDSLSCATGGGGTTGFYLAAAIKVTGGAGTARELYSDSGTNTGIHVEIDASNKLSISAGNGTAFTTLASTATVDVGTTYLLEARISAGTMYVRIGDAAAESTSAPTITAGTAGFTLCKDNNLASDFMIGDIYRMVYFKNTGLTDAQIASSRAWVKAGAGL